MTAQQEIKLLIDIAKLLDKYGTESFERLADSLSSPETIQVWVDFLRKSSSVAQEIGFEQSGKEKHSPQRSAKAELENIKIGDPEKYEVLNSFYDALQSKTVLPTLREIRYFAEDGGLPSVRANTREKAISPLIKSMIPLGISEINSLIGSLRFSRSESFNDLAGWSDIILNKKGRK